MQIPERKIKLTITLAVTACLEEVVVALLLISLEPEQHGVILEYGSRFARMPTSQNRDMGHPILPPVLRGFRVGHPPNQLRKMSYWSCAMEAGRWVGFSF